MSLMRHLAATSSLLASAFASSAYAFEFSPIVAQFAPKGAGATRSFLITNSNPQPAAIQLEVFKRTMSPSGEEIRTPETEDFIVTPPQMVVAPGASQNVRVQWIGEGDPKQELSYRLIVNQLPIPYKTAAISDRRQAQVQLGYRYEAAVYITPAKATPDARLVAAEPATDKDGAKTLAFTLESAGTTRALLAKSELKVRPKGGGAWTSLDADALKPVTNVNLIAGSRVRYEIAWPAQVAYGPIDAEFSTEYVNVK